MSEEQYLSIPDAVERVTGSRPNPVACWRWAVEAKGSKRLESKMVGGRRKTKVAWVNAWIERRTKETTPDSDRTQEALDEVLA